MSKISDETQTLVQKIVDYLKPERIIVFGSVVRGEADANSDIDLLIIKKSDKKRPFRIKEVFEAIRGMDRSYPLDPIVYTPEEIAKRLSLGDYFVKRVLTEGKVVYGSE